VVNRKANFVAPSVETKAKTNCTYNLEQGLSVIPSTSRSSSPSGRGARRTGLSLQSVTTILTITTLRGLYDGSTFTGHLRFGVYIGRPQTLKSRSRISVQGLTLLSEYVWILFADDGIALAHETLDGTIPTAS